MTFSSSIETSLLMPFPSVGLLGSGAEGAHALALMGINSSDLESDLREMVVRLETQPEGRNLAELCLAIAGTASSADGWLSVRSLAIDVAPMILLLSQDQVIAVCLHGSVVEWAYGDHTLVEKLVKACAGASGSAEVIVTAFREGEAWAGLRLSGGTLDLAAKDSKVFARLSRAADDGASGIWEELLASCTRE